METNGNQNDAILTTQFDTLDLQSDEGYTNALTVHEFHCEHDGCDVVGTADMTVPVHAKNGKKTEGALFGVFQLKAERTICDQRGNPIIDRETKTVIKRQKVVLRQILCRKHADINKPAAEKAGFKVEIYSLPENLEFLRRMGQERTQRDTAKEFFVAMAKGAKTVEDGIKAGLILPLPPEGEETKPDQYGDLPNILAVNGKLVGLISGPDGRSYMFARKENVEIFNSAGLYLYWCPLKKARALAEEHADNQAAWKAKMADRDAEAKRRNEERAAAEAESQNLFAGLAQKFGLKAPDPAPKGSGDRRSKPREKRGGEPRQVKKPEPTPEASAQIREELETAAAIASPQVASPQDEVEEPRGSQPPTLTASLAAIAVSHKK